VIAAYATTDFITKAHHELHKSIISPPTVPLPLLVRLAAFLLNDLIVILLGSWVYNRYTGKGVFKTANNFLLGSAIKIALALTITSITPYILAQ